MSLSLREQLLAAGLGNKKQAKQAEQEERRRARDKERAAAEEKRAAEARAAKAARDLELNRQKEEKAARKARHAEIKQLIEQHRLPKLETDDYFNFIDRAKVRRICVDADRRKKLMAGELRIVRCEGKYDVVAPDIAQRIGERHAQALISLESKTDQPAPDDPYKDFVVPDDLIW
ncbi:MAG TPA: DUF2058 domain-containing protein [Steroidobacteraceae bacterium]|nr:DUF2058 domain-containing protein [Steroidobacteraceae bacterium]